jgi:Yip1 domain
MTGLGARLVALAVLSFQDPRAGFRALMAEAVPLSARSAGLLLVAVLSTILLQPSLALMPPRPDDLLGQFMAASPLRLAILQWLILGFSVVLVHRVGVACGGKGRFEDALLLVVWLQVLLVGLQVLQVVLLVVFPPLAGLVGLASLVVLLWLSSHFIAELHGFSSAPRVLAGILLTAFLTAFIVAISLTILLKAMEL